MTVGEILTLALGVTLVGLVIAITVDMIIHDDYPEPYDDER